MEGLISRRAACRGTFTRTCDTIEESLREASARQSIDVLKAQLLSKYQRLEEVQEKVSDFILKDKDLACTFDEDFEKAEKYRDRYDVLVTALNKVTRYEANNVVTEKRKYKLPEIKFVAFSGDPREFLGFWAQFSKIHEDNQIVEEDKFQYLLQSVVPGSRAARLVGSFPPTKENYSKVIEQLRERFGREDLLVQIYVRELLGMVSKNALQKSKKCDLTELYDTLESKLLALESLGRTKEKYGEFLEPLIESCLPESILRVWERSRSSENARDGSVGRSLTGLMQFLKDEVQSEEMVRLARTGIESENSSRKQIQEDDVATVSALVNSSNLSLGKKLSCIFCNKKSSHNSADCYVARKMSYDDRKKLAFQNKACLRCLRVGHTAKRCRSKGQCFMCNKLHVSLMCPESEASLNDRATEVHVNSLTNQSANGTIYLQTLIVKIIFQGKQLNVRAILDTASQQSYLSKKVVDLLGLPSGKKQTVSHCLFGGRVTSPRTHTIHTVEVRNLADSFACYISVLGEDKICGVVPKVSDPATVSELNKKGILVPDLNSGELEIDLLLGADVVAYLISGKSLPLESGLVVFETKLGNVLFGRLGQSPFDNNYLSLPVTGESVSSRSSVLSLVSCVNVHELWDLDTIGITHPVEDCKRRHAYADTVVKFKDDLTVLPDGRYEVRLPFKGEVELPDNKSLAFFRHKNMCLRAVQSNTLNDYISVFQEWEQLGIIEKVPSDQLALKSHYLPHRPIIKNNSQTMRVRPVFDASAKQSNGCSLNQCLIPGPNLIELIPDILDRFRLFPVGLSGDIEKAFLQISIAPSHRDFLRFFFPSLEGETIYRHRRLVFGLSPSPYLLAASLSNLLDNSPSEYAPVTQKLRHSFYVDNCVTGVADLHEQEHFISKATEVLSRGCFNLRGWESNLPSKYVKSVGTTSLLGILWDLERDTLKCNVDIPFENEFTKRKVLALVQRVFDPIGVLCPALVIPKLLLQEMWRLKASWDATLPEEFRIKFEKWFRDVSVLGQIELPRFAEIRETSEVHVFVDACKTSYAVCIFLRAETSSGVRVQLLRAKTRVAPLKQLTIPRLELMACCIGARLAHSVKTALDLPGLRFVFWSDSMIVLWWLLRRGEWSVFVENRISEIKQLFPVEEWRHVPGNQNPADLPSRGCHPGALLESRWWEGPLWLYEPPSAWPNNELFCSDTELEVERRKIKLCNIVSPETCVPWYANRFSSYTSIVRLVAWIFRFKYNAQNSVELRKKGDLSSLEVGQAEKRLIRFVQSQYFPDGHVTMLNTFYDEEGIMRVKTRLTERADDPVFKCPVLLPDKCMFTTRLIEHFHKVSCHAGTQILLNILRDQYWILRGRRAVRKIVRNCMKCQRYNAKSVISSPVALPADRINDCAVFAVTAVDYAGPLFIKGGDKVWIALFTCATYRAIHLELASSLDTDTFILCLRRFIARRGRPHLMYSDNGTNFKGAYNELRNLDWNKIQRESHTRQIVWKFNPPTASWWGGFWERLVRTVKELLRRTLGKSVVSYEELGTILCDCEAVINSRPLTYLSENAEDLVSLTPAMFLRENYDSRVIDIDERDASSLRKRVRYRWKLLKDLRQRFRNEYLGLLVNKAQCKSSPIQLRIGDIVLVGDDVRKRINWPLAKVVQLLPGRDGIVRTIKLKTQTGTCLRPIQRIFPLEINNHDLRSVIGPVTSAEHECQTPHKSVASRSEVSDCRRSSSLTESEGHLDCPTTSGVKVSRYGRILKAPQRYDLFRNPSSVFAPGEAKRGEDVGKTCPQQYRMSEA